MLRSRAELDRPPREQDRGRAGDAVGRGGWRQDDVLRRLIKNGLHLLGGRTVAIALAVGSLAIMARALGPEQLGILVMIEAYVRVVDRVVRLETWQALVTYGAAALERGDAGRLSRLVKFGVLIDVCGAVLATLVAVVGAPLVGRWLGWSAETVFMAQVYGLSAFVNLASAPLGVLRLYDRFPTIAWLDAVMTALRLVVALVAYLAGAGLWAFVMLSMGSLVLSQAALAVLAFRELGRRSCGGFLRARLQGVSRENPRIWEFIWSSNATVLIRRSTQEFDNLLVGSLLGPAAVGLYHISKRLGTALTKAGGMLQQAIFPDLARLWARGDKRGFLRIILQVSIVTAVIMGGTLLFVGLNAERLVTLLLGARFDKAALPLVVQLGAVTLLLCGSGLRPALTTMGLQMAQLKIAIVSAGAFYACILLAVPQIGLIGANLAHVLFNGIWLPAMLMLFVASIRKMGPPKAPN